MIIFLITFTIIISIFALNTVHTKPQQFGNKTIVKALNYVSTPNTAAFVTK